MWAEWWLVLAAISIILLILLGLLWLVIEFPGLTGWKVVHKESPEGQARQEKWRRDSLVIEQRERFSSERKEKRRGSRVRRAGVDHSQSSLATNTSVPFHEDRIRKGTEGSLADKGVQCLMEVEEKRLLKTEENFDFNRLADQARARSRQQQQQEIFMERGEELVGVDLHSIVSTDDEDSGVFPHHQHHQHHHHHFNRNERRGGKGECHQPLCKGSSVVIVIAGGGQHPHQHQRSNKDHSVLDSLDLALGPHAALRPS